MPRYPGILETDTFIQELANNCAMASIFHDNLELTWTHDIMHKTYEQLADSGGTTPEEIHRWRELDNNINKKTREMIDQLQTTNVRAAKDIRRKIHLRERLLHEQNQTVKGRQLIWLILNSYARDSERRKFATMTDLREVQWRGKENVVEFIDEWTYYRQRITGWSDEEILNVLVE